MGFGDEHPHRVGVSDSDNQQEGGTDLTASIGRYGYLLAHPAVERWGLGVSTADLVSFTEVVASLAQARTQKGAEKYVADGVNHAETLTLCEGIDEQADEVLDEINYKIHELLRLQSRKRRYAQVGA